MYNYSHTQSAELILIHSAQLDLFNCIDYDTVHSTMSFLVEKIRIGSSKTICQWVFLDSSTFMWTSSHFLVKNNINEQLDQLVTEIN